MIGWLYRMIIGRFDSCRHSWETTERHPVFGDEDNERPAYIRFVLRCKSCGDITYRNT